MIGWNICSRPEFDRTSFSRKLLYESTVDGKLQVMGFRILINDILLQKLFWPTVRKKCSDSERSEQFLATDLTKLEQLEFKLEKIIGI